METQLILPNDLGYIRHCHINANRQRQGRRVERIDTLAREHHKQLMLLERDVIKWFGSLTKSKEQRILRYKSPSGTLKYQEIDFIADNETGLKFCELKFKQKFNQDLSKKASGLAQLETTTSVAASKYKLSGSLAICVDMSFLYTGKPSSGLNFTKIDDLKRHFQGDVVNEQIWLDMEEILPIALTQGWMTESRINEIREVYELMQNPMSVMSSTAELPLNNPFSVLRNQSNMAM